MNSARCPACGTTVWFTDNTCPSCKAKVSLEFLVNLKKQAGGRPVGGPLTPAAEARPLSGGSGAGYVSSTGRVEPAVSGPVMVGTGARSIPPAANRDLGADAPEVTRRTSSLQVFFGLLLIAGSSLLFMQVPVDNSNDSKSRRLRALEAVLGETGTELLLGCVAVGAGAVLIATSRKKYRVPGGLAAATTSGCRLCGQKSLDTAPAFITVYGGFQPFAGVFRCNACEECSHKAKRLRRFANLQIAMLLPGLIFAPIMLMFGAIVLFGMPADAKPGGGDFVLIGCGISVAMLVVLWLMQRHLRRKTAELLGPDLDEQVRTLAVIKKWGWPRRIGIARDVEVDKQIVDLDSREVRTN
jgi:hypothetical protein